MVSYLFQEKGGESTTFENGATGVERAPIV